MLPSARLLIVEDHPLYLDGLLALLLRCAPQLHCRAVDRAEAALAHLRGHPETDLVLSDLRLPGPMDGLALLAQVGRDHPTAARVLVSGTDDPHLPQHARRAGLMGFLPKSMEPVLWVEALSRILQGDPWFPASAAEEPGLTPRQALILERLAVGHGSKAIADELGITERTIKYHVSEVFARLQAGSRAEAVARASARGWIRLPGAPTR